MSWGEALDLTEQLSHDVTSWVHAARVQWDYPASHEFFAMADLYDAFAKVNFKKSDPYPRPFRVGGATVERIGEPIAPGDMAAVLAGFGRPVPDGLPTGPPPPPPPA